MAIDQEERLANDGSVSDAVLKRALMIGATVIHRIVDQTDYPSRDFTVADPDGNHWTFATFAG